MNLRDDVAPSLVRTFREIDHAPAHGAMNELQARDSVLLTEAVLNVSAAG